MHNPRLSLLSLTVAGLAGAFFIVAVWSAPESCGAVPAAGSAPADKPAGKSADKTGGYELVAPLDSVMEVMGSVFSKMPKRVEAGSRREFRVLKKEAFFVAEIANLAGKLKGKTTNKEWVSYASKMKTSALTMAAAAGKRDAEGFKKAFTAVKESCGACHEKFRD